MSEPPPKKWIVDSHGLNELADASGNLKPLIGESFENGILVVNSDAWKEFEKVFPTKGDWLKPYIKQRKIRLRNKYFAAAASLAETTNMKFPHGDTTDLYTAAISLADDFQVLTIANRVTLYTGMGCSATDVSSWLNGNASS